MPRLRAELRVAISIRTADYLLNNAGIAVAGEARDISLDDWRDVIDTSLYGAVAAYPIMLKQGSGQIINTASPAGLIPAPSEVSYSAPGRSCAASSGTNPPSS